MDDGSVLCIFAKDGHIAVIHTAINRPPFQPAQLVSRRFVCLHGILTLDCTPDEVQQNSLQQRNVTSTESPSVAVLYRESDVPPESTPSDECGKESDQKLANNNHHHTLTNGESISCPEASAKCYTCTAMQNIHRKVLGVCQFETFSEFSVQYPKKWNQPQVLRDGGSGMRSRLDHESTCSCSSSSPLSWIFSFNCRNRRDPILSLGVDFS